MSIFLNTNNYNYRDEKFETNSTRKNCFRFALGQAKSAMPLNNIILKLHLLFKYIHLFTCTYLRWR